jgi:DNA-binding response OmpR family regulator
MASRRPKVLLVDDEEDLLLALHGILYRDNARYDVLLAGTAEIAYQILLEIPIDVLVTDVQLPDRSGMDLLSWAAIERPEMRAVVMTAFDARGLKDRARAFGCIRLLQKPFDGAEMRATILRAIDRRDAVEGTLAELSTVDVIQMLCIGRKSMTLRLSEGSSAGAIHIERGEVVDAVWDGLAGEEAFFRMLAVKSGVFHTSPLPADIERTITADWQYLLMEGLRRLDEAGRDHAESVPPAPTLPTGFGPAHSGPRSSFVAPLGQSGAWPAPQSAPPSGAESKVSRLVDEGFEMLRAGRRDDARMAWEEALRCDPHNRRIQLNLRRLDGAPAAAAARR